MPTKVDVIIFGGGIAGLWVLARLRQAGYAAILFESGALGGIQTIAAQGIIHGGTKYALAGKLSDSAQAIGDMPQRWRACLTGEGELDLSKVRVLSPHQYLWSSEGLGARMTGFFASKLMRSRIDAVAEADRPELFQTKSFQGSIYRLEEPVLDVPSLVAELVRQHGDACFAIPSAGIRLNAQDPGDLKIDTASGLLHLQAQQLVLAAGTGNETLLRQLSRQEPCMQRRPLQMLMVRGQLPELYAHCLGVSANPRLTVTSYPLADGDMVWHLGGQVAESGVGLDEAAHIAAGKAELAALLPWLKQDNLRWASRRIDRAELAIPGRKRPDNWCVHSECGLIITWPTKLAFAPCLAAEVQDYLERAGVTPTGSAQPELTGLSRPPLAQPPWDKVKTWS
ncbi:Oxidoreductase, FAD-binding [hydrothermal vent metagenome]|uniref:Oxidoreductase, FAD-binding n=1 Tax=hydrothermal vent metagenome TaxID=652676 RepID=A0A3B1BG50_9ZZZZ